MRMSKCHSNILFTAIIFAVLNLRKCTFAEPLTVDHLLSAFAAHGIVHNWCDGLKDGTTVGKMYEGEVPTPFDSNEDCKTSATALGTALECIKNGDEDNAVMQLFEASIRIPNKGKYQMILWTGLFAKSVAFQTHISSSGAVRALEMAAWGRIMDHLTNNIKVSIEGGAVKTEDTTEDSRVILPLGEDPTKYDTALVSVGRKAWELMSKAFAGEADPKATVLAGQSSPSLFSYLWTKEVVELVIHDSAFNVVVMWFSDFQSSNGGENNLCNEEVTARLASGQLPKEFADSALENCNKNCGEFVGEYECGGKPHGTPDTGLAIQSQHDANGGQHLGPSGRRRGVGGLHGATIFCPKIESKTNDVKATAQYILVNKDKMATGDSVSQCLPLSGSAGFRFLRQ